MLEVTLMAYDPSVVDGDNNSFVADDPIEVPFVSLVNGGTHGAPALVAPGRASGERVAPTAKVGEEVLYINTAVVPAFRIKRLRDR